MTTRSLLRILFSSLLVFTVVGRALGDEPAANRNSAGAHRASLCPFRVCFLYNCTNDAGCKRGTTTCYCGSPLQATYSCSEYVGDCCPGVQTDKVLLTNPCEGGFSNLGEMDNRERATLYVPTCSGGFVRLPERFRGAAQ